VFYRHRRKFYNFNIKHTTTVTITVTIMMKLDQVRRLALLLCSALHSARIADRVCVSAPKDGRAIWLFHELGTDDHLQLEPSAEDKDGRLKVSSPATKYDYSTVR
jgi:hypothetical protein